MIGILLEINAWCALAMLWLLAALVRRDFFAGRLDAAELVALSIMWPIALLLIGAEWVLARRGHR